MEIIKVEFLNKLNLVVTVNIAAFFGMWVIVIGVSYVIKRTWKARMLKSVTISETNIGIGKSSITVKYDKRIQEIAYKIWVEINTRKIGILFDEEYDVLIDVYDSWYSAFGTIRNLLSQIPAEKINDAGGLIEVTTKVLNEGLRPHLTRWQVEYRNWYEKEKDNHKDLTPQKMQRLFPEYRSLISDLKKTNEIMIHFSEELKKIVYSGKYKGVE